jgi:hypothetical protein
MTDNTKKQLIVIISVIIIALILLVKLFMNYLTENYSTSYHSWSLEEAKKNGVFIQEVKIAPSQIQLNGESIEFKECWIEQGTKITYTLLFFKTTRKTTNGFLCFTLKNAMKENIDTRFRFRREGAEYDFACSGGRVYFEKVDSLEIKPGKIFINNIKEVSMVF